MDLKQIVANQPETELVYLSDSYAKTVKSNITRVVPDEKKAVYFLLDGTIFHPKSGGQPSDIGKVVGKDFELEVRKAMMVQGKVVHWAKVLNGTPQNGGAESQIDWGLRYFSMRRHSAGHLFDHCLTKVSGANVQTVDSWVGDDAYIGYSGTLPTQAQLTAAENMENRIISKHAQITATFTTKENLLKKAPHAPNMSRLPNFDKLRIVTIQGSDPIPCGGTHLKDISEIGSFRITKHETVPSGFRVYFDVL